MKYAKKHCSMKLPVYTSEGATNNAKQCWIQDIKLPYKFISPWVTAGSLQINTCTKPTIRAILQTKFQYIWALKCIVYWLPDY